MVKYDGSKPNIKAVILAGSHDVGCCPVVAQLPTALWPVAEVPVLEHLLNWLANQGIKQAIICSNGNSALLMKSTKAKNGLKLEFLHEPLPIGTAGCIRDAAADDKDAILLVFSANIICPPRIETLISMHRKGKSELTMMFNPACGNGKPLGKPAEIYVCESSVLQHIPKEGYFDIKEGLIPKMIHAGKTVHAAVLPKDVGNFRDWRTYLYAIADYLKNTQELNTDLKFHKQSVSQNIWMSANVDIDPSARIYGPVVISDGTCVLKDAVIIGPTIIGRNVTVAEKSVVTNSVIWDGAKIGTNCQIQKCVVDYEVVMPDNVVAQEKPVINKENGLLKKSDGNRLEVAKKRADRLYRALQAQLTKVIEKLPGQSQPQKTQILPWIGFSLILIAFLWSYWPNLVQLWNIWQRSDEYSSGLLVPLLVVYILWSRRRYIAECPIKPSLWGLFAFIVAQAIRLFGLLFMYSSAERLSIVLSIAALVLLLFGWKLFRKLSMVLLFLCLMLPWPNQVQSAVGLPLQRWATSSAVFCLETIGFEVIQEGNVIHIGNATVAVAEACNGLRMVTAFFVISGLVVLIVNRAWWEKLIIIFSSLPIALLCNTIRLTITAIAFTVINGEHWEKIFHDFGGYAMMPLALAAVITELWLLTKLTTLPIEQKAIIVTRQN